MNNNTCKHCGKEFIKKKNGAKVKYCSDKCYKDYRREYNRIKMREANPPKHSVNKVCEHCGDNYEALPRGAHSSRFCSDNCKYTWWSRQKGHRPQDEWAKLREKQKEETRRKKEAERKARIRTKDCSECGESFKTIQPKQLTCSTECSRLRRNRLAWQRDSGRLNANNIVDKDITIRVLYKRDKGICYICGGKCNPEDFEIRGGHFISGPTYPSTDHIIPLARGGKHAWDNVKLAHHRCNGMKSDILPSELGIEIKIDNAYALARKVSPRKKEVKQYCKEGKLIAVYESTAEAERQTGIKRRGIQNCARGEIKTHKGFIWKYA